MTNVFTGGGGGGVATPQINPEVLQAQAGETTGSAAKSPASAQKKKAPSGTVLTSPLGLSGGGETVQRSLLGT